MKSILLSLVLAVAAFAQPQLHMGYQNVPRDGTGRLGGGAVDQLSITQHDTAYWVTHVMARAFYKQTHDKFYREVGGKWVLRGELLREYANFINEIANEHLDFVEGVAGGRPLGEVVRVFVDLELDTINRRPYIEPDAEGYGSRDVETMLHLCNRIEFYGRKRWQRDVLAGPYHPIKSYGHWAGLREPPPEFLLRWHSEASGIWPLLDRRIVWVHNYTPSEEPHFARAGQTWRQFTRANVRGQFEAILASGAVPDEVWVWDWSYTAPTAAKTEGVALGLKDVLEEDWPWTTHFGLAGDWGILPGMIDAPVEMVSRRPLVLSIETDLAGKAIAHAWLREVEAVWSRTFVPAADPDPGVPVGDLP